LQALGLEYFLFCYVLISENKKSIQREDCKDKFSSKKCKKLKKKGKCEDKKTYKKCMETCQKCTQGTIAIDNLLPSKFKG
jgi:hypothetical protein